MLIRTLHPAPSETYRRMKTVATMLNLMIWKGTVLIVRLTAPSAHHTMGSLKVGTGRHVLNAEGAVILGLYAAGVITGGIHGGICLAAMPSWRFSFPAVPLQMRSRKTRNNSRKKCGPLQFCSGLFVMIQAPGSFPGRFRLRFPAISARDRAFLRPGPCIHPRGSGEFSAVPLRP